MPLNAVFSGRVGAGHERMSDLGSAITLLIGSTLSAWLRFDRGSPLAGWITMLACIAVLMAGALLDARRKGYFRPKADDEDEAESESTSSSEEDQRFVDALRSHHQQMQLEHWREIRQQGPGALIFPAAGLIYFWLCVFVLAFVPPWAVPAEVLPRVPRSVLVLSSLATLAVVVAVPLGLRNWWRVLQSLRGVEDVRA